MPLYEGELDGVTPGSSCIANAYVAQWRRRLNHGRRPSEPTTISRPLGLCRW